MGMYVEKLVGREKKENPIGTQLRHEGCPIVN